MTIESIRMRGSAILNKNAALRLYPYLKGQAKRYCLAVICIFANAGLTVYSSIAMMRVIDIIPSGDIKNILWGCGIYFISSISATALGMGLRKLYQKIGDLVSWNVRSDCLHKIDRLSGADFTHMETADMLKILESDMGSVATTSSSMYLNFISEVVTSLTLLGWIVFLQIDLIAIFISIQLITFSVQHLYEKRISEASEEYRNVLSKRGRVLYECIANVLQQVLSKSRHYFLQQYSESEKEYLEKNGKLTSSYIGNALWLNGLSVLTMALILGYGGYKVIIGSLTLGGLMAFNTYAKKLMTPIMTLAELKTQRIQSRLALNRIWNFLDKEEFVKNFVNGYTPLHTEGILCVDNVSFAYDKGTTLKRINITFTPATCTALVGASGSGKTTLLYLLYRLWDPDMGKITLDGIDIREYKINSLRDHISIIGQDVYLFDDSLWNNITLGKTIGLERMREICNLVMINNWIDNLPEKMETRIGENGIRLSGGQKQRISIARALVRDSSILILDEATSAMDVETEHFILSNIRSIFKTKTIIIVSHRLTKMRDADMIYVMKDGQIVENGNHEKLISSKGYYQKLYHIAENSNHLVNMVPHAM